MDTSTNEVRVTSATGGEKGTKPAQLGAIDPLALWTLAEVAGYGAEKYSAFNYLKGYDWSLSFNAAMRHALAFWMGEDYDEESGLPHAAHFAWHGLCMTSFFLRDLGTDDRFLQDDDEADEPLPGFQGLSLIGGWLDEWAGSPIVDDPAPQPVALSTEQLQDAVDLVKLIDVIGSEEFGKLAGKIADLVREEVRL